MSVRLNLGCGHELLDGYTNVDLRPPADIIGDFSRMTFENVTDVRLAHVLEHFPWRRTSEVLHLIRSWCDTGATITVEVPDMPAILELGTATAHWQQWIYGEQGHAGECHLAGFTKRSLEAALTEAGWDVASCRRFRSDHPARNGYPCIEAVAHAGH